MDDPESLAQEARAEITLSYPRQRNLRRPRMDDPEQLRRDREEQWILLHQELGRQCAERERCRARVEHMDTAIRETLEEIAELRERTP